MVIEHGLPGQAVWAHIPALLCKVVWLAVRDLTSVSLSFPICKIGIVLLITVPTSQCCCETEPSLSCDEHIARTQPMAAVVVITFLHPPHQDQLRGLDRTRPAGREDSGQWLWGGQRQEAAARIPKLLSPAVRRRG